LLPIDAAPFVADTGLGQTREWTEVGVFRSTTETIVFEPLEPAPPAAARSTPRRPRRPPVRTAASSGPLRAESAPGLAPRRDAPPREPPPAGTSTAGTSQRDPGGRLPTAQENIAAQRLARVSVPPNRTPAGRPGSEPTPTIGRAPAAWKVQLALGWPPAAAAAVILGVLGLLGSWTWAIEAEHAGVVANRLVRVGAKVDPLPPWATAPDPKWWKATPSHLALWALWLDRTASDLSATEEAHELLRAAAQASPLEAQVRFALARRHESPSEESAADVVTSVALSRDVFPLAWTGQRLLAAGKKEAAVRAYRAALEMAARADLARLAAPEFIDDTQIRRYALPGEDLIGPIIADMADQTGWTYAEWSRALPPLAVVRLAAVRVLRERASPESEALLDALASSNDPAAPGGGPPAVPIAARAEALALKQQWREAEQAYRRAVDLMPDPTVRRSWWMNVAEIALRQNDESSRQKALEAARGADPSEEITRRAVELLKYYGGRDGRLDARGSQDAVANSVR
jgi:hypothetical protein